MERVSISERLTYVIPPPSTRTSFLGCAGLVIHDDQIAIIDGNMGPDETPGFLERERPNICIVSHFHVDHSRWAHEAAMVPGVTLHVPDREWRYLADMDHFVERCGMPDEEMARMWKAWLVDFAGLEPVPGAEPLAPGTVLDLGRTHLEVVAAPGHSPGHQAYWIEDEGILFCVDIGVDSFGPWYGWKDADLVEYIRSIRRLADLEARLLVTSHGGIIENDVRGALTGCIDVMRRRERAIARDLDAGLDVPTCSSRGHIYGDYSRFPPPLDRAYAVWEENMVREHVRLLSLGGVDAVGG